MVDDMFESLVQILQSHAVPYDRDVLKAAFDSDSRTVVAWMEEYTSPQTLLTKEEAAL